MDIGLLLVSKAKEIRHIISSTARDKTWCDDWEVQVFCVAVVNIEFSK